MTSDLAIAWKPSRPYQQHFYTFLEARSTAILFFVWTGGAALALFIFVFGPTITASGEERFSSGSFFPGIAAPHCCCRHHISGTAQVAAGGIRKPHTGILVLKPGFYTERWNLSCETTTKFPLANMRSPISC